MGMLTEKRNSDFTIHNNDNWQLQAQFDEDNVSLQLTDRWKLPHNGPIRVIIPSYPGNPPVDLLKREIEALSESQGKYGFEVHRTDQGVALIFGKYGLAGGGRFEGFAAGLGMIALGTGLMIKGNYTTGSVMFGAGVSAARHAYSTKPEEYRDRDCAVQSAIGGATSLATGVVSKAAVPVVATVVNMVTAKVICSAGVSMAVQGTQDALNGRPPGVRTLIAGAAGAVGTFASEGVGKAFGDVADDAAVILTKEACKGAAGSSSDRLARNYMEGKPLTEELLESTAAGAMIGAASAIPDAVKAAQKVAAAKTSPPTKKPDEPKAATPKTPTTPKKPDEPKAAAPKQTPSNATPKQPPSNVAAEQAKLAQQASDLANSQNAIAARETAYATLRAKWLGVIKGYLGEHFHDKAHWTKNNPEVIVDRLMNGEKVKLRHHKTTVEFKPKAKADNPANDRATWNQQNQAHQQSVEQFNRAQAAAARVNPVLPAQPNAAVNPVVLAQPNAAAVVGVNPAIPAQPNAAAVAPMQAIPPVNPPGALNVPAAAIGANPAAPVPPAVVPAEDDSDEDEQVADLPAEILEEPAPVADNQNHEEQLADVPAALIDVLAPIAADQRHEEQVVDVPAEILEEPAPVAADESHEEQVADVPAEILEELAPIADNRIAEEPVALAPVPIVQDVIQVGVLPVFVLDPAEVENNVKILSQMAKAQRHIARLEAQKRACHTGKADHDHASKAQRAKKQGLTQQIDIHNQRLAMLEKKLGLN